MSSVEFGLALYPEMLVSLRVGCKFHAFIIKVNNSLYFWSITAGLYVPHTL